MGLSLAEPKAPTPSSIDVIIPAYNASRFIGKTIQSVLDQTYLPARIIVVDDGSTDGTSDVVRAFRSNLIQLISIDNGGVSRARNRGIKESTSEFVAFLDADDIWLPDKLQAQLEALQKDPKCRVVYSGTSLIDENGSDIPDTIGVPYIRGDVFRDILEHERPVFGSASSVTVSRSILDTAGYFDESIRYSEDIDLWLRFATLTKFTYVEKPVVKIRIHTSSATRKLNWEKDKQVILQHFYVINKFIVSNDYPEHSINIQRRRIIRLFFRRNAKVADYYSFCKTIKSMAPRFYQRAGGNFLIFTAKIIGVAGKEFIVRARTRLLLKERLALFLSERTIFFSHSKSHSLDKQYQNRRT